LPGHSRASEGAKELYSQFGMCRLSASPITGPKKPFLDLLTRGVSTPMYQGGGSVMSRCEAAK
jgi:hypothetical protein